MSRLPTPVRLARSFARLMARSYPRSLGRRRVEIETFNEDAIDQAWHDRRLAGVIGVILRLIRDVVAANWRGTAMPVTSDAASKTPVEHRRRGRILSDVVQDLRHETIALARKPGFTAAAVLTLALGIGANTAIFTVVNGVLLRPLPYPSPDDVVQLASQWNSFGRGQLSEPEFIDLSERSASFATLGLFSHTNVTLIDGTADPEQVSGVYMTPTAFQALGVPAAVGRVFEPDEGLRGAEQVVVLSDAMWQRRFAADSGIIGRRLNLRSASYRVVGVMPPDFDFPDRATQVWMASQPNLADPSGRGNHSNLVVGRLRSGVTPEQAQGELDRLAAELRQEFPNSYPPDSGFRFAVQSRLDVVTGPVRPALLLLLAAASLVLLIACVNVANLFLARIAERQQQIALRAALGAGTGRLVRQLVTGSLVLSTAGGICGIAVAAAAVRGLLAVSAATLPRAQDVSIDATVLLFGILLSAATGLAVGLLPARRAVSTDLVSTLKEGSRSGLGIDRRQTRSVLVVAEVALATVLLVGAGLLLRSFSQTLAVDPGFNSEGVTTSRVSLDPARYGDGPARADFFARLAERLVASPGIASAGAVSVLPLSNNMSDQWVAPEGHTFDGDARFFLQFRLATPGYFDAMQIPIVKGRNFLPDDVPGSPAVAVISASLATRFWGDEEPIGRRIVSGRDTVYTVVGVVGDVHSNGLAKGETPMWYRPYSQSPSWPDLTMVARATGRPDPRVIGDAVHAIDPLQPVFDVRLMSAWRSGSVDSERLNSQLVALLASLAVVLSGIGLYAVISYSVSLRTREIGIRMALGANQGQVRRDVVRHGLILTGTGVSVGVMLALWVTRALATRLYGVTTTDVPTYVGAALLLAVVALIAEVGPAVRATRVDPIIALRNQ